jgi:hypothetical protein
MWVPEYVDDWEKIRSSLILHGTELQFSGGEMFSISHVLFSCVCTKSESLQLFHIRFILYDNSTLVKNSFC